MDLHAGPVEYALSAVNREETIGVAPKRLVLTRQRGPNYRAWQPGTDECTLPSGRYSFCRDCANPNALQVR
jgi:hypothetical protein